MMHQKFTLKKHSTLLTLIAKSSDILLYLAAYLVSFYQQFGSLNLNTFYQIALLLSVLLMASAFSFFSVYTSLRGKSLASYFQTVLPAFFAIMTALASIAFITKTGTHFSRFWFLLWHAYALIFVIAFRILLRLVLKTMRKKGFNHKRIAIIGINSLTLEIVNRIKSAVWVGFDVVVVLDDEKISVKQKNLLGDIKTGKIPKNLSRYVEKNTLDEIWIVAKSRQDKLANIVSSLNCNVVAIRYFPAILGVELLNHSITEVLGMPVVDIIASPMNGINRAIKAIEDRALSFLILILISPLFLTVALLVKMSSKGPIFYRQKRIGWNGKEFEMLKFRSMPVGSEKNTGAVWATPQDKRATKIGAILRKTSLDELPQFINVLRGEMSIVGPRPERPVFVAQFKKVIPNYMLKHMVKAGVTGWAQVNGWRGNTDLKKRIEHDIFYINHWSLWLDLRIICLTILRLFNDKNAY